MARRHIAIINKHKQIALTTFETFSNAAGSDLQTKSAVLLEATHTIFSTQSTGYINPDSDNDSSNRIVEIFKSFTSSQVES